MGLTRRYYVYEVQNIGPIAHLVKSDDFDITRHPIEWDGSGLPPVGCECEVNLYGWWVIATVLAYGKSKFLYEIAEGQIDRDGDPLGGEHDGFIMQAKFRPIRTKAERDREELYEIASKYSDLGHVIADAIITAGFKKSEDDE